MTPDAEPQLTRETAFHPRFSALTRNYTEYRGYWLPKFSNDGPVAEYWACRERAAIMDLSPLRKFEITGPDSELLLQYALTRNVRKLAVGQVVYTAMCYEHGGMIDDGTLFRLGDNNFRWIGGDDMAASGCANSPRSSASRPGCALQPISCTTSPCKDRKLRSARGHLDAADAARLAGTAGSASPSAALAISRGRRRRLAHRLYRGARLRDLLPSQGRADRLRCDLECRRAAWVEATRARGARHLSDRGRPRLLRLRILRPDGPIRGRNWLHRTIQHEE